MSFQNNIKFLLWLYQLTLVVVFASSAGCVKTEHPISEAGKIIVDPELEGDWMPCDPIWGEDKSNAIRISLVGKDTYRMASLEAREKDAFEGKLIEADGKIYFEIETINLEGASKGESGLVPSFIHLERKGNWIALRSPNAKAIGHHIELGTEITGKSTGYFFGSVTINSTADTLVQFLSKHGEEVLGSRQVYRRIDQP